MQGDGRRNSEYGVSGVPDRDGAKPGFFAIAPDISGAVFWEWHVKKGLYGFSREFFRLLQTDPPEGLYVAPQWLHALIHAGDLADLLRLEQELLEGRSDSYDFVFRIRTLDRRWIWVSSKAQVSGRENGEVTMVSGVITHVSRLRFDGKFQPGVAGVGDNNYHVMLENSPDWYVRMDRELFPLYMNPVVRRYLGRERERFHYNDSLEDLKVDPEYLAFIERNVHRVFDEGETIREKTTFRDYSGKSVFGEFSFWPEYDGKGRVATAMARFRDLTEQAASEQNARLNEHRLSALYELTRMEESTDDDLLDFVLESLLRLTKSGSGFIFLPDTDLDGPGRIIWSHDHFGAVDVKFLEGNTFPPDLRSLVTGETGETSFPSIRNGNGLDPVHISFDGSMPVMRSMIDAAQERGKPVLVAGVCNKENDYVDADIKQLHTFLSGVWLRFRRRLLMRELRRAKEAAEEANKAKSTFLANISHELRTPLNGMLSMLQLLSTAALESELEEYVKAALFSGNTLVRIISDILDLSRMETGQMQLALEQFRPKESLHSALRIFTGEALQKGLAFTVDIDEAIPDTLFGDDARMRQIVFNLVGNALKFTDSGGISVRCSLLGVDENGATTLSLMVSDTGIGIPLAQREKIFEAFSQGDGSATRRYPGTGLGLSIVKRLVALMKGTIEVESEPGKGATIRCTLVFAPAKPEPDGRAARGADPGTRHVPMDVLVAEDDEVSAFALRSFLKRSGHRAFCVPNGRMALEALQLHGFDCLFTDIQMPEMDGMEVAERIRGNLVADVPPTARTRELLLDQYSESGVAPTRLNAGIPIVAVSAHAMAGDRERFLQHGITEYISKPIVMEQLSALLARLRT